MEDAKIKVINLGFVNVFLLKEGGNFVLIDTGLSFSWKKLESELISAGALPDKLKLVILTHGDQDHSGNCKRLKEKYKTNIAIHRDDYSIIETGFSGKRKVKHLSQRLMFSVFSFLGKFRKNELNNNKFTPDIYLNDEQSLAEYGFNAKIIHIPGHTRGSIGVLTDQGDLFAGDIFVNRKKPEIAPIVENEEDLKKSIERIKGLDVKTVYPGHGSPFLMKDFR